MAEVMLNICASDVQDDAGTKGVVLDDRELGNKENTKNIYLGARRRKLGLSFEKVLEKIREINTLDQIREVFPGILCQKADTSENIDGISFAHEKSMDAFLEKSRKEWNRLREEYGIDHRLDKIDEMTYHYQKEGKTVPEMEHLLIHLDPNIFEKEVVCKKVGEITNNIEYYRKKISLENQELLDSIEKIKAEISVFDTNLQKTVTKMSKMFADVDFFQEELNDFYSTFQPQ